MLERMPGYGHSRFYLSTGRTPISGLASIPARWPALTARARGAGLVHAHGDMASSLALPLLRARPSVMTTHGLSMLRRATGPRLALIRRGVRGVARATEAVICTSSAERDELAAVLPADLHGKLRVVHNAIDPPPAVSEERRAAIRRELAGDPDTVLGVFAGQLDPNKAPLLAAGAAIRARAAGAPIVLAFAGEGPLAPQLQALAGDAVRVLGFRRDLPEILAAADVFVAPSEREGMSFALLEAMAHGMAILAADGPGNPEALGQAGLVVRAGDEEAFATALAELASDAQRRRALGDRARTRALEHFGVERFLAETQAIYDEISRPPGP